MDKKVRELLNRWLENGLINQASYEEIVKFEEESSGGKRTERVGHGDREHVSERDAV